MANYFNNNLKYLRKINNISQKELSKKIGVDQSTISYWEKGMDITVDKAIQIADVFNVPYDKFFCKDLRIESDVQLDENHKLDNIIMEKSATMDEDTKKMLIGIMDSINNNLDKKQ